MFVGLFVCLLQLVSCGYWEKDPNVKQVLLWWFKTRRQYTEPELSWYGWMPITIWTQTMIFLCPCAIKIHQVFPLWLENPSSGFPVLPCCFSGMCQGQCSGFSLIIHSKCFPPSFLISFRDEGLLVSRIITFTTKPFWFCSCIFFWALEFQRFSSLCKVWKIFRFDMWIERGKFHLSWGFAFDH